MRVHGVRCSETQGRMVSGVRCQDNMRNEHPTLNIQRPTSKLRFLFAGRWMLDVECWALNQVSTFTAPSTFHPIPNRKGAPCLTLCTSVI
jgi:hypothetical protein